MRLAGYQPLTLIDFPGHIASIVFTQGCVFRCVYCHNPELIPLNGADELSVPSILAKIKTDIAMLDGVVITGGEPTVHPDLPEFLAEIKSLGLKVKLDTNGVHPRLIERCLERGLIDFIAMDIKQRWDKYPDIIGAIPAVTIANCQQTCAMLQASGVDHEFRTTLGASTHTLDDVLTMASYFKPGTTYSLQPIRYEKVYSADLKNPGALDVETLKAALLETYPELRVQVKG